MTQKANQQGQQGKPNNDPKPDPKSGETKPEETKPKNDPQLDQADPDEAEEDEDEDEPGVFGRLMLRPNRHGDAFQRTVDGETLVFNRGVPVPVTESQAEGLVGDIGASLVICKRRKLPDGTRQFVPNWKKTRTVVEYRDAKRAEQEAERKARAEKKRKAEIAKARKAAAAKSK